VSQDEREVHWFHAPASLFTFDSSFAPLVGLQCAASMALPLVVGIAAGFPRAAGWGAVGAFFTDMAVAQPGRAFRARIVAGTGVLVALAGFLGSLCGIYGVAIYPVVALWTFGAGLMAAISPQAALIGASSATSLVYAAVLDTSVRGSMEVGAVMLASGLATAAIAWACAPLRMRFGASPQPAGGPRGVSWARSATATLRAVLRGRTTTFWYALRLCTASVFGTVLFRILNPTDGFWIPEATIFIMRPDAGLTRRRALLRVIGSVSGAALTTLLLLVLRPGPTMLAVLSVLAGAVAFSVQRVNFGLYITFVTCIFVLLTAFGGLPVRGVLANRVIDNLIGSAIAVAALWLWPARVEQGVTEPR
jgi:Fusaric acid resistance protein-like